MSTIDPNLNACHRVITMSGWSFDVMPVDHFVLVRSSAGYMATIDFEQRVVRGGMCTYGRGVNTRGLDVSGPARYTGRGWRDRLVADAVEWLRSIEARDRRSCD